MDLPSPPLVEELITAMRASETRYRTLLDNIPLPTFIYDTETLACLAVNQAAIDHYGYSRAEFSQLSASELRPAEDVPLFRAMLATLGPGPTRLGVWRHKKRDGSVIDVDIYSQETVEDGRRARLTIASDVTARRTMEAALRESEERFRLAFQTSPDAMSIARLEDGRMLAVNQGFSKLTGWTEAEVVGRTSLEIGLWPDAAARARLVRALGEKGSLRDEEVRMRGKDGEPLLVQLSSQLLKLGSEPQVLCICRDITAEKRAREEHALLLETLRQSQKMEAVGQLAGGVAHDFNNLLTVISNYADFVHGALPEGSAEREDVEQIRRASERATSLTRQLLAFSRRQVMKPRVVDLNRLVADMDKMVRRLIGEHIELTASFVSGGATVLVDPHQLEQVLLNLIVNSRDAMPKGGRLALETLRVSLGTSNAARHPDLPPGEYVLLTVADNGIGMDAETARRAFEPFFTTKQGRGTGLGLSTAYGIIKQSGGHIALQTRPGAGATFRLYLPAAQGALPALEKPEESRPATRSSETVLLVEDDALVRETARQVLSRSGFRVLAADGGPSALRLFREEQGKIDLLLSDVVMPLQDGPAVARALTALRPSLRVLLMSGYAESAIARHGVIDAGMELIEKPFSAQALVDKVRAVLAR